VNEQLTKEIQSSKYSRQELVTMKRENEKRLNESELKQCQAARELHMLKLDLAETKKKLEDQLKMKDQVISNMSKNR
jgi:hypothetical protein